MTPASPLVPSLVFGPDILVRKRKTIRLCLDVHVFISIHMNTHASKQCTKKLAIPSMKELASCINEERGRVAFQ
jgi:hypothetical protein